MTRWWPTALERRIALRYLRGQRGTRNASLQTVIAIGSITLGVTALIVVLGVMNGLRNDLRDRILVASPHLRVQTYGRTLLIPDWQKPIKLIREDPDVVAASPEVAAQSLTQNSDGFAEGVIVSGIDVGDPANLVVHLDSSMTQGDLRFRITVPDSDVKGAVVIGNRLAQHLSVGPGDLITMLPPGALKRSRVTGEYTNVQPWTMEVTGVFQTGMYIYDNSYVMMDRVTAQRFAGLDTAISDIAVRVRNPWQVQRGGRPAHREARHAVRGRDVADHQYHALPGPRLEKVAMGLVIFFIMIVAAFNIVGTLTMVVAFKTREIGILQAMGLSSRGVGAGVPRRRARSSVLIGTGLD